VLLEAARLNLSGEEVDRARKASEMLGSQVALRTRLGSLLQSDEPEAIYKALAEAEDVGLAATPEVAALRERVEGLEKEKAMISELRQAVAASNQQVRGVGEEGTRGGCTRACLPPCDMTPG
jgi:hypothetical protein